MGFFLFFLYLLGLLIRPQDFLLFMLEQPVIFALSLLLLMSGCLFRLKLNAPQYFHVFGLVVAVPVSLFLVSWSLMVDRTFDFVLYSVLPFLFAAAFADTLEREEKILAIFIFCGAVMALHGVDQILDPDKIGWSGVAANVRYDSIADPVWQIRYVGIFNDPNDLGMYLLFCIPLILYFLNRDGFGLKVALWIPLLLLHLYAVWLTNSRGTMVALMAIVVLYALFRYGGIKAVVVLAIAVPILTPVFYAVAPSRMLITDDSSSMERIYAWNEGIKMFKWRPVFGIGKAGFMDYHPKTAHNSWVLVLAELGMLGYSLWMAMLSYSVFQLWYKYKFLGDRLAALGALTAHEIRERKIAFALLFAILGALAAAFFLSRSYIVVIFLMCGLAVAQHARMKALYPDYQAPAIAKPVFLVILVSIYLLHFATKVMS
ncbi:O-antigen ligase family protein [Haliea sp. E1-2-M8]|uniref:O-antigen ligase family protein n=1 Tax=Haliea sp. E1-2-M8 TaxID=3064706 RepID=UPI00271C63B0|nr:O-antigen ligase family protein [Haliea sp. E1-2-M8]MDO8860427.1 O-antigen ligase family protein [Haliea sp. E1-2-M8]